jgi:quinoprotein glucose dehydrogenase
MSGKPAHVGLGRLILCRVLAVIIGALALAQIAGGVRLAMLGGSPYYLVAAAPLLASAVFLWRADPRAGWWFHLVLAGTLLWAIWEAGFQFWPLLARLGLIFALWLLVVRAARWPHAPAAQASKLAAVGLAVAVVAVLGVTGWRQFSASAPPAPVKNAVALPPDGEWTHYGRTLDAQRFSPLTQINTGNVAKLVPAWTFRTGDGPGVNDAGKEYVFEATPLKIRDNLYLCTSHSIVIALDAETGRQVWRFDPRVAHKAAFLKACRGVGYYQAGTPVADCPERIISPTLDGRLIALDARTGALCASFGQGGQISAVAGMNPPAGFAYITSAPLVVGRNVIVGGWVNDGYSRGEPSGVVRAFDAVTGALVWAWDVGKTYTAIPPGGFTPGTPNSWAPMSADPVLGLVYMPTGNATPDYWGAHRSPEMEKYSSSIVAVDAATGQTRWTFQTLHHDVWDFDVPSAPVLFTDTRGGRSTPALAQTTKSGEVFVLDRRTGQPLTPVREKAVPRGAAPGDWVSPTQPFSDVPSLVGDRLTEARMWGVTPIDQIACRIAFHSYRYDGRFTPQSLKGTITYPAPYGATDWGGATYDPQRGLLIVNSSLAPFISKLLPRRIADGVAAEAVRRDMDPSSLGVAPQFGAPYGMTGWPMLSPLSIPCLQPPWGYLTAIDLSANKVAWKVPLGTARDTGPLGLKIGPPIRLGVFSMGGPISTQGGVTFIGGTLDRYLSAVETSTGRMLWRGRLPAGGQATPLTYTTRSGRQMVVISAGGHGALMTKPGDYVVAFALPRGGS